MFRARFSRRRETFPDPRRADAEGLVAVTPCVTAELLIEAYTRGIFPWSDHPACWFSPDPRAIFDLDKIHFPKRLLRLIRQGRHEVTFDREFAQVMDRCRAHHSDSWISAPMVEAYTSFHRQGYAHSVEVWKEGRLVGGLYGVQVSGAFAGESMFFEEPDASKIAFFHLVAKLRDLGVVLFDAQVINEHTERMGAFEIGRECFLDRLQAARCLRVPQGSWSISP